MNEFDIYTVHKIGELFGIQQSEKHLNEDPTKSVLQTYLSNFQEECSSSERIDFFLFVYCGTHSTARRDQHALLLSKDDGQEEVFLIEAFLRKIATLPNVRVFALFDGVRFGENEIMSQGIR